MPIVNLSANFVSKAVCPEGNKKINYYHKDIRGFLLEVRSSGGKHMLSGTATNTTVNVNTGGVCLRTGASPPCLKNPLLSLWVR